MIILEKQAASWSETVMLLFQKSVLFLLIEFEEWVLENSSWYFFHFRWAAFVSIIFIFSLKLSVHSWPGHIHLLSCTVYIINVFVRIFRINVLNAINVWRKFNSYLMVRSLQHFKSYQLNYSAHWFEILKCALLK